MKKFSIYLAIIGLLFMLGCEEDELSNPEDLTIEAAINHASTFNASDGAIDVTLNGGVPPYSYFWSTGAITEDVSGLAAGDYTLRVVFGNSGVSTFDFTIEEPEPVALVINETVTAATTFNGTDGAIALTVSGGTSPYTYLWSNGEETPAIIGLEEGVYEVTVTDASTPNPITTTQTFLVSQPAFVCGQDSIKDVDGYLYPTVQLGEQCWLAANLKTEHNPNDPSQQIDGRFCTGTNCSNENGAHYTWAALMNGAGSADGDQIVQGICPTGWHVPTKAMWAELSSFLSADGNGGTGTNVPNKMRGDGSSSGFNALYAGNFGYDVFEGDIAVFWSATINPNDESRSWYRLINEFPIFSQGHEDQRNGLSVRCIKD